MPTRDNFDAQITFRCYKALKRRLESVAKAEETDESRAGRLLLGRGLAAYERDGLLREPKVGHQKSGVRGDEDT